MPQPSLGQEAGFRQVGEQGILHKIKGGAPSPQASNIPRAGTGTFLFFFQTEKVGLTREEHVS